MAENRKIIVAVTGASGSVYALSLIRRLAGLKSPPTEIATLFTETANRYGTMKPERHFTACLR